MLNLAKDLKIIRVMNAVAAGTSNQDATTIDTAGYDGVVFLTAFGTITATAVTSVKLGGGAASDGSDKADLAGTGSGTLTPTTHNNKVVVTEIYRPQQRYITLSVLRGTANAVIDGSVAILYRGRAVPTTNDASVAARVVTVSPATGTP